MIACDFEHGPPALHLLKPYGVLEHVDNRHNSLHVLRLVHEELVLREVQSFKFL